MRNACSLERDIEVGWPHVPANPTAYSFSLLLRSSVVSRPLTELTTWGWRRQIICYMYQYSIIMQYASIIGHFNEIVRVCQLSAPLLATCTASWYVTQSPLGPTCPHLECRQDFASGRVHLSYNPEPLKTMPCSAHATRSLLWVWLHSPHQRKLIPFLY